MRLSLAAGVVLAAATIAGGVGVYFGGPRLGYLPGIAFSAGVAVAVLWRYQPSPLASWLVAILLVAYFGGGSMMVGDDVLAHVSLGSDALRYDRLIHVAGAAITVLLVAQIAAERQPLLPLAVLGVAVGAEHVDVPPRVATQPTSQDAPAPQVADHPDEPAAPMEPAVQRCRW